ncbi:MAG TPA: hypothetical protein PKH95_02945 [Candidatus Magasanikbacteria bacterium]|nr:hypothetical protein [Candidatus Magasanikbacteria bacterium]
MRRKDLIKDVKIVEPPIHELHKGSSVLMRSCFLGCGFFFVLIIGLLIGLRFYIGSGLKTVTILPPNFPLEEIPLYNKDKIDKMTFITGESKSRRVELAAILPKIIMIPFLLEENENTADTKEKNNFKNLFKTLASPVTDKKDNFKIEWQNIDNSYVNFINTYQNELRKKNFIIDTTGEGSDYKKIDFSRTDGYTGTIYAENKSEQKNKITHAFLMLNMPPAQK